MTVKVQYGNCEGRHFAQWRFDLLTQLLTLIHEGPRPGETEVIEIEGAEIWYDSVMDFHRLRFRARGHYVAIRLYIVLSAVIDGEDYWGGCPRSQIWDYAIGIRKRLGVVVPKASDSSQYQVAAGE